MSLSDYYILRKQYLEEKLNNIPEIHVGTNSNLNKPVVRYYSYKNSNRRTHEYFVDTDNGKKCMKLYEQREYYKSILDYTLKEMTKLGLRNKQQPKFIQNRTTHNQISLLPASYFEDARHTVKPEELKTPDQYRKEFHGIRMRSLSEVAIAEVLESMQLEFLYEPQLVINGKVYSPDFIIHLPELNCCILIEYMGMTSDQAYMERNAQKMLDYSRANLKSNVDIIYLMGNENSTPDPLLVRRIIETTLGYIAESFTAESTNVSA